jgi:protein-disulfide isomerase
MMTIMSRLQPAVGVHDHLQGYRDAELALVMYGDYECAYSARAHLTVKSVQQQLRHRLLFVFRYFPLRTLHAHAEIAAETAEASAAQGKFWQMHDKLFENQHALEPEHLLSYACVLGLDSKRIASELAKACRCHCCCRARASSRSRSCSPPVRAR